MTMICDFGLTVVADEEAQRHHNTKDATKLQQKVKSIYQDQSIELQ